MEIVVWEAVCVYMDDKIVRFKKVKERAKGDGAVQAL